MLNYVNIRDLMLGFYRKVFLFDSSIHVAKMWGTKHILAEYKFMASSIIQRPETHHSTESTQQQETALTTHQKLECIFCAVSECTTVNNCYQYFSSQ